MKEMKDAIHEGDIALCRDIMPSVLSGQKTDTHGHRLIDISATCDQFDETLKSLPWLAKSRFLEVLGEGFQRRLDDNFLVATIIFIY
jgi:hypothetical protein